MVSRSLPTPANGLGQQDADPLDSPASCDSSDCSQCQCRQRSLSGRFAGTSVLTAHALSARTVSAGGSMQGRKRSAEQIAVSSSEAVTASGAALSRAEGQPACGGGADAAFIASLHSPRRRKLDSDRAEQALHRSAGSSTQLVDLAAADTDSDDAQDPQVYPATSRAAVAADAKHFDAFHQEHPSKQDPAAPRSVSPSQQRPLLHSAQSSATCLADDSPGSQPESRLSGTFEEQQAQLEPAQAAVAVVGAAAKLQQPQLRHVAAFRRPLEDCCLRQSGPRRAHADIVCDVKFSADGGLIATAGVGKQIRVYSLASAMLEGAAPPPPAAAHRMSAKLSSLAWSPACHGVITVGDYDGSVQQVHVETGHFVADADEHGGRRVWSVAHSVLRPNLTASAADDGVVQLWQDRSLSCASAALLPAPGIAACGVDFCAEDANLLAVASADSSAYVYDLRNSSQPLYQFRGHRNAVSFVRFHGAAELYTASVDGTIQSWDLSQQLAPGSQQSVPSRTFSGHANRKNFVGLSVATAPGSGREQKHDALIACGSEAGSAHVYHSDAAVAPSSWHIDSRRSAGTTFTEDSVEFISSVCWQPAGAMAGEQRPLLAAAASDGDLRLLALH